MKNAVLSQDIQQLFNEYKVEEQNYQEVTQDERYRAIKSKWGGLSVVKQEKSLQSLSSNKEKHQHSQD